MLKSKCESFPQVCWGKNPIKIFETLRCLHQTICGSFAGHRFVQTGDSEKRCLIRNKNNWKCINDATIGTPLLLLLQSILIIQHNLGKREKTITLETLRRTIETFHRLQPAIHLVWGVVLSKSFFLLTSFSPKTRAPRPDHGLLGHLPGLASPKAWMQPSIPL